LLSIVGRAKTTTDAKHRHLAQRHPSQTTSKNLQRVFQLDAAVGLGV